ncbi:substrate-binding domain-containing protein [Porticoccus sp.]|uniref:substrate-binding domain-containing protein n=1 Tax=Porticoccus sp. TaxID=2024853 RepID=UPI003F6A0BCC
MEADIALRATNNPPEHLVGRKLMTMPWQLYGSKRFALDPPGVFTAKALAGIPLIGPEQALLRLQPMQWLEKHRSMLNIVARANTLIGMAALVRAGLGIALLPEDVADGLSPLGPLDREFQSDLWLLTHRDLRSNARVKACSQFLTERLMR